MLGLMASLAKAFVAVTPDIICSLASGKLAAVILRLDFPVWKGPCGGMCRP